MQYDSNTKICSCWIGVFYGLQDSKIDIYCFPTLGIAMQHYAHEIVDNWDFDPINGWYATLKLDTTYKQFYRIQLKNLLIEEGKDYESLISKEVS